MGTFAPLPARIGLSSKTALAAPLKPTTPIVSRKSDRFVCKAASENPVTALFKKYPRLETGLYFGIWYFLNVKFNILNKQVYNYFPYPWFVSVIHWLLVSSLPASSGP